MLKESHKYKKLNKKWLEIEYVEDEHEEENHGRYGAELDCDDHSNCCSATIDTTVSG